MKLSKKAKKILSLILLAVILLAVLWGRITPSEAPSDPASGTESVQSLPTVSESETAEEQSGDEAAEKPIAPEQPQAESEAAEESEAAGDLSGQQADEPQQPVLDEHGSYDSREEVCLYLQQYGHLPENYITKKQAEALGWQGGSLEKYAPGKCIGGSRFGNYEGLLPEAKGRSYTECDIDTLGAKSRGAKRIVFSNDGLIYYTEDHYESFELLAGTP